MNEIEVVDPDQIDPEVLDALDNELLYDPAPRGRRGHRGHRKGRGKGKFRAVKKGNHTVVVYDPAPSRMSRYRKKAKDIYTQYKAYVIPGAAGVTFLAAYNQRAQDLFSAGKITKKDIVEAITYDLKNLDASAAFERLKTNAGGIIVPGIAGVIAKGVAPKTKGAKPYVNFLGDILIGFAIGKAGKTILDPPISGSNGGNGAMKVIEETGNPKSGCPECHETGAAVDSYNPYMPGRGY